MARSEVLHQIKAAFRAHNCKDYPNALPPGLNLNLPQTRLDFQETSTLALPPLDRTVLGTASGYWIAKVTSEERTPQGTLVLALQLTRDLDGESVEVRSLELEVPLSEMEEPLWQTRLAAQVRKWIEEDCGDGFLKISRLLHSDIQGGSEADPQT